MADKPVETKSPAAETPQELARERVLRVEITLERIFNQSKYVTTLEGYEAAKWELYLDQAIAYLRARNAYPPFEKLKWSNKELLAVSLPDDGPKLLDWITLEWAAKWVEDSLVGETSERTIEFGKNMAMTLRAAKPPIDFSCRVCGIQCDLAPDPPARAVCPAHCEDHDYRYEPNLRGHYCFHCGQEAPRDWSDE